METFLLEPEEPGEGGVSAFDGREPGQNDLGWGNET
jgi:hypothetical protein